MSHLNPRWNDPNPDSEVCTTVTIDYVTQTVNLVKGELSIKCECGEVFSNTRTKCGQGKTQTDHRIMLNTYAFLQ